MERKGISRRHFLQIGRRPDKIRSSEAADLSLPTHVEVGKSPALKIPLKPLPSIASAESLPPSSIVLRPPGAIAEEAFQEQCQNCGNCIEACPVQAIYPMSNETTKWLPAIDPAITPCGLCPELTCTQVCPSGALLSLSLPNEVRMGTAVIEANRCTAWRGLPCRICYDVCPIPGVIQLEKGERTYVPVAGEMPCVGCGICLRYCPAEGAIQMIPFDQERDGRMQLKTCQRDQDAK